MEMLLNGDLISSKKAAEIGLINEVVDDNDLGRIVLEKALKISKEVIYDIENWQTGFL